MTLRPSTALIFAAAIAAQTHATQITGSVDFSSIAGKDISLLGGSTFAAATGLHFLAGPNAQVDGGSGDFAPEVGGTATLFDFTFAAGRSPVWVLTNGHFSFDLDPGAATVAGTRFLIVNGIGTIHDLTGILDDTAGVFTFTTQGAPLSGRVVFSWSATTDDPPAVPDAGATAILLGAGLIGLGAFAHRKS